MLLDVSVIPLNVGFWNAIIPNPKAQDDDSFRNVEIACDE
jgi:hypothetical protein